MSVCGIDVGSLATPADVAWLEGTRFELARYLPSAAAPLPDVPEHISPVSAFALDAPQSLPTLGSPRRVADRDADTPTRVLPVHRHEIAPVYATFVEAGLTIFWAAHERGLPVVETYPRFTIRTLWPDFAIPSKRRDSQRYIAELWARIRMLGYTCRPPVTHHEIDAMLCALAAASYADGSHRQVGAPLVVDETESVLREGYIVVPAARPDDSGDALALLQQESYARAGAALIGSWPRESALGDDELRAFLDERRYCVLATASADGLAQARPVGFTVVRGAFWFATVAGGRLRNLKQTPWASVVVSDGEGEAHRAVAADGPITVHPRPPEALLARWEERFGSSPEWAVAWLELRAERLYSYRGR